ncbi:alpha/beta hydrolase [Bradyrhizobium sp. 145]|uniref:alpha/beta hydrolase n=1 Tax=Bradyrhizobium sp. 145 TaxID=2782621 RepID=UPI001FF91EE1|nr:alpha/beta hydrolase [Bradyrhizobium sp. 145]
MWRAPLSHGETGKICRSTLGLIVLALCCCACSRVPLDTLLPVGQVEAEGVSVVPLLVATTRNRTAAGNAAMFDSERADQVNYASIAVSIPPDASRTVGQVQWPTSSPGDPRLNFVTVSAEAAEKPAFGAALAAAAKKPRARGRVLVFVHGFNNRFDEAVYRFAHRS